MTRVKTQSEININLFFQSFLINKLYPNIKTNIDERKKNLICLGCIKDDNYKFEYEFNIEYYPFQDPKTTIIKPTIDPSPDIHMYKDHSLCLYHKRDFYWGEPIVIAYQIIPWLVEWTGFYELYRINNGVWEGKSVMHGL
jgi:hypothetical protein